MYLSKLEIFGFKSFANKTPLVFTKGITGIVGPNGCGKTNIVDALRWCLGEQKSSTLRSDKMENVIFNGTRNRKPMGMSEVSLTMVNDAGILPTEYSEVTITRRIFRSGESEYLLNKNICRLKDITNLFMDTGMGTNAYSVIELKMVETILSSKAEERRKMFEEAAGVNKYKLRRRLSLKKLEDVKRDLTRVNDIVAEVDKTVRSLERQAKRADKYNQIQSVLREKELDLAEREYSSFIRNRSNILSSKEISVLRRSEIDNSIREIENELIIYRSKMNEIEQELSIKRNEISSNTEKIHNVQRNISVAEERHNSLNQNISKYSEELGELKSQFEETEDLIVEYAETIEDLNQEVDKISQAVTGFEDTLLEKKSIVEENKNKVRAHSDNILSQFRNLTNKENQLSNLKQQLDSTNSAITKLNVKIQDITNDIAKTVGYLEELDNERLDIRSKLEESESQYLEQQNHKEELVNGLGELKERELEEKGALNSLRDKIEFLKSLLTNLEGVSKASKALLSDNEWNAKEKNIFADVGNTSEEYRFALEAALKNVLNNVLVNDFADLEKAIKFLRKNDLGKASFYLLQSVGNGKSTILNRVQDLNFRRKIKKLEKEKAFIHWAYKLVQTDKNWKPYFEKILSSTALTADLKSAMALNKKYPEFNYVTLDGDFVQNNGVVVAGSSPKQDETLFGRKQLIEELELEYPKFEKNVKSIQASIQDKEIEISNIDLKTLSEKGKFLANDLNNLEKQISQIEFEKKKASEEAEKSQEEINAHVSSLNTLESKIAALDEEITIQREEKEKADNEQSELEAALLASEESFSSCVSEQNTRQLELERSKGQLQNTRNALKRSEESKITISETISKREKDIQNFKEEIESISSILEDNQIDLDELNELKTILVKDENEINDRLKVIKSESNALETSLNALRKEREEVSESIHSVEIKINQIDMRVEQLLEHIKESYSIDLTIKEFEDMDTFNFNERSDEVHQLKEKLKDLGPINLLAFSEYEEEKERLDFLFKQRNDLVESEKDLVSTIHEINETAEQLFVETFDKIRENFRNIFQSVFNPGDEADLIMEEGVDPLEGKIEIIAKPKGKRPTSIELLSGGEKTLTATALLFAIYLVKPSPFCILDEVDAPLDDANVDRFTRLLKDFSDRTQFIIVTHNKRTMEAAENMYGVTMQEEGISKLVGVQFNEEISAN
ncbi:MAG: chromosome segregation protein SMC [Bacteroidetes bacterium]|nr:chromosome segregation protein SMC [Bacteroidota bacterium]